MARERPRGGPSTPPRSEASDPSAVNRPAHEIRLGRIKAAIWRNTGDSGPWFSVVICRLYKEGNDWRQSDSYSRDDLPLVMKVADMAHTWIYQHGQAADA
jgi:hypothetical protein